jgi:tetratricopeptide (TPR) repeat protein/predicted Ser/Thr protein kinase
MEAERWRKIQQVYHSAIEQEADSRAAFVATACAGDEEMRQEVESLLAHSETSDDFLEKPAMQVAAKQHARDGAKWNMAGKTMSHYRVIQELGAGGMGVVYLARDETLDRQVALKVLPTGSLADETARKRLRKEALALAKLSHPNIETIYELGSQDGVDFLVTEYVAGTTLADRIASGPLPESELLGIASQICSALEEAAGNGLVHLDLKPRNMMLTPKGQVKLLDFGLARIVKPKEGDATWSVTTVAVPAGTPPYMAPEQLMGGPLDARTDIYAVGACLYELATGRTPFRGASLSELIVAVLHTPPEPPSAIRPGLSPGLERAILRCLQKAPEQRYQTVGELLADLHSLDTAQQVTALPALRQPLFPTRAKAWLRPWRLGLVFLGLGAAILAFVLVPRRPALSFAARDWVLVADFDNQTNDPVFDQSLLTAFSVSLEQSRYANIYPRARIREVLARMKKDAATKIDEAVAQEIAVREGIRALILPSISGVGDDYRLASRIRDVKSGIDVKTAIVKAKGRQRILDSLDELAAKVRADLGESLPAVSRTSHPLPAVTTASLDALKQYSIGAEKRTEGLNLVEAKLYFENALKIDPAFTAARTWLGILNFEHFDREEGKRLLAEAVRSADNLTDREKYGLLAFHARAVEGNPEKAVGYDRVLIGLYPDSSSTHNNLGVVYLSMGRYPEAVNEYKECLRIDPRDRLAFFNLAQTYITRTGDLDLGIAVCNTQIAQNEKFWGPYCLSGYAYLAKGQFGEAVKNLEQSVELEPKSATCGFDLALAYSMSGQKQDAIKVLNQILATDARNCDAYYDLGIVYDSTGDGAAARRGWLRSVNCRQEALTAKPNEASEYLEIAIARTRLGDLGGAQTAENKARSIDPKLYFDTARLRSIQGRTGEAVELLERAEKNGLTNFAWVKLNPDLRSLSTQPRFVALLHRNIKGLPPN